MTSGPFMLQDMQQDARDYFERKQINLILESIVTGLIFTQPDDPLAFIEDCAQRIKKGDLLTGKSKVRWDQFIPPPSKENIQKRKEAQRRIANAREARSKKLTPISHAPSPPPVTGAFIMPEVSAKPIVAKYSVTGRGVADTDALPSLPNKQVSSMAMVDNGGTMRAVNHPNIFFVLGGPGSGKGTQCAKLAKEFNLCHLSTGDLLREELDKGTPIGKECAAYMKEGKIVPMSIILSLLKNAILANLDTPGFLIDGFPRAMDQALEFENTIGRCRSVLYFSCPLDVLEARLLERGKTSGRVDDNLETIKKRFKTFEEQSMPVVDHFDQDGRVIKIPSVTTIDEVYNQTRTHFLFLKEASNVRPSTVFNNKLILPPIAHSVDNKPISAQKSRKDHNGKAWRNIVFVLGGPGCGKGTQCVRLAKDFNYTHLSAGDLLRAEVASGSPRAAELDQIMKEGKIVPTEVTLALLREAMERASEANGFLIDGFPRQLDQAIAFEETVAPCKFVLYFDCPESLLESRLLKRGETSGRADDNIATIKKRFKTFVDTSMPVIEHFRKQGRVVQISSEPAPEVVYINTKIHFESSDIPSNVVFVLGGPGSGKGTQCARLAKEYNLVHLSTGDLLRAELNKKSEIGLKCGDLMKEGKIVPKEIIIQLLKNALSSHSNVSGFLVDGFPRAMDQAVDFEKTVCRAQKVLFFHCPLDILEARLLERGKTSGRADDNLDTIRKRFKTFEEESLPVVNYFETDSRVIKISSVATVDEVYAQTISQLRSAGIIGIKSLPFDGSNIVFVLGGPGSGKGTQCDRLVNELHYCHLSTGDLLRDEVKRGSSLGNQLEEIMREGKMVPLEITLRLLTEAMERNMGATGFLIDGFPRTMEQAIEFEAKIGKCKFVLFFDAPNEVLTQRLLKRGETSGRADDNLESIKKRLETFQNMSMPVVDHFQKDGRVKKVIANGNIEDITKATMDCFTHI